MRNAIFYETSVRVGVETITEKAKHKMMSRYENGAQTRDKANKYFRNAKRFEYMGTRNREIP
jgi:hypothetical protein